MNTSTECKKNKYNCIVEIIKWILVIILLVVAIVGNYMYRSTAVLLRALIIIILISLAGSIAFFTKKGKAIALFAREAHIEVRKVIWPTRQEALRITLTVIVVTTAISLILWGVDGILVHLISFITSLRF